MNRIFSAKFFFLPALLVTIQFARAYDVPQFETAWINPDALLIKARDKETLIEALTAVASNFPGSKLIDEDLREKSLAVALRLDPLNANARLAHRALARGGTPAKTAYFKESVSAVSERLWTTAEQLARGEPDARKLSLYLKELSLVLHPEPPIERIRIYGKETNGKGQSWKKIVTSQPKEHPSNRKLESLFTMAKNAKAPRSDQPRPSKTRPPRPMTDPAPVRPPTPIPTPPANDVAKILLTEVQIPFIAQTQAMFRGGYLGGLTSLSIVPATTADAVLFGPDEGRPATLAYQMRLVGDPDGLQINGFARSERLVRRDFPAWPDQMLARVRFTSELPMRSSPRLTKADASIATSLLLHSAFSGKTISPQFIVAGNISQETSSGPVISLGKDLGGVLEQAQKIEGEFLLLPDNLYQKLVDGAVASRQLKYLFAPQLISYSDWNQLKATAFGEGKEAIAAASKSFLEIEAVQDKMTLVDLAKNEKVQDRLNAIISTCPQHLSARIMLAFGKTPDDPKAILRESVRTIDQVIDPFLNVAAEVSDPDAGSSVSYDEAEAQLEEVDLALAKLRNTVATETKPYFYKVEDFMEAAEKFLEITNKETSTGQQRLRELKEAFAVLQTVRETMGMEPIELDNYREFGRRMKRRFMLREQP